MAIQLSGVQLGDIGGGPSSILLEDLGDVSIASPQTGQYLRYNASISEWQNIFITDDVFDYLNTNLTSSNGISLTKTPGPDTIDISLSLSATGDVTGTVASGSLPLTLATVNSNVGTFGSSTSIPVVTVNAKGLVTSVTTATPTFALSATGDATGTAGGGLLPLTFATVNSNVGQFAVVTVNAKGLATAATNLTGDATSSGAALTLATVNSNVGTFGSATLIPVVTVNAKGLITAVTTSSVSMEITGDATGTATAGSIPLTFATVNANVGTFGSDTLIPVVTVNAKGLITAISTVSAAGGGSTANLAGGAAGSIPYQSAPSTTVFVPAGTSSQVLISGTAPAWTNTPTLTGTNFTGVPNSALTNSSVTVGSTNIALGATSTTIAGLTSVSAVTSIINSQIHETASSTAVTTNTLTDVDTFATATYRSAKYLAQIADGTSYEIIEFLIVHDNTTVYITTYGSLFSSAASLGAFDAIIATGTLTVRYTALAATSKTVKLFRTAIVV